MENGVWVYYDSKGDKVTNEWRLSQDGGYYYLDGYGNMLTSSFIDDRYVDYDGRMITSAWRQIDGYWYFFDSNGKMARDTTRVINGKSYSFDEEGAMLTGWVLDGEDWYYCDASDGHMITGAWAQLAPSPDMYEDDTISNYNGIYDTTSSETYWFYFQNSGKVIRAQNGSSYQEFTIGSERYAFDVNGRMSVGWIKLKDTDPLIAGYKYFNDDESLGTYGAAHTGWLSAYPPRESDQSLGTEIAWYYFDSRGVPYYTNDLSSSSRDEEILEADLKRITVDRQTRTYLFDEYGNPVYGLRKVRRNNGVITSMYFGTKEQSCLQYGEIRITESDGTTSTFYFTGTGYGFTGEHNRKLYYMGKLQKAVGSSRVYIRIPTTNEVYLVNSSGYIQKNVNSKVNDREVDYKTNSRGLDDGGIMANYAEDATEPEFNMSEV